MDFSQGASVLRGGNVIHRTQSTRTIIGSGKAVANPGRIAGGAAGVENPAFFSVYPNNTFPNFSHGNRPGGLIDKKQQANPESTKFGHPFDGSAYRSISTQAILPAIAYWNGFQFRQEVTPEIQPHERGTFFRAKAKPVVKTIGGAANTGAKSDTTFHPQRRVLLPLDKANGTTPTEKVSRAVHPASFITANYLRSDPNNSAHGVGRWSVVKRGANE